MSQTNTPAAPSAVPSAWERFKNSDFLYYFKRDKVAMASFTVFLMFLVLALAAPILAPTDPYGLQLVLGIIIGLSAGYFGGRIDSFLMRFADVQLSFSTMMVAIIVSAIFKASFGSDFYSQYAVVMLVVIIGVAEWPQYARTIRASVLAEKKKEYVEAARVMGFKAPRIMFRHILPNCLSPILVISTVQVANAIMSEAALSFLGLGLPVDQPSLGALISIGFNYIFSGAWWITAFPGIVLVTLVLVINLLGDWLRDVFNPKLYKG
ncbi:ABC transporter permease [Vibrio parahaemolyticus]